MVVARGTRRSRSLSGLRGTGVAGMVSAAVIALATIAAIFGPLLAPYNPDLPNLALAWVGPVGGHLLGFDFQGRDVLSRLLAGAQSSMLGPLAVVVLSMTAGAVLAVVSAWRRGAADAVISSGLDILFAFPGILLAVLATAIFGAGPDRGVDRALHRLHALRRPRLARGGAARAQPALRRRARGAGLVGHHDLPAAHHPEHACAHRGPGDHHVRLGHGRPRRDLVPRPRRAAAGAQLGRDDLGEPDRPSCRVIRCRPCPPGYASWRSSSRSIFSASACSSGSAARR